jgi:hypothetical protein
MRLFKIMLAAALIAAPMSAGPVLAQPVNRVDTEAEVQKLLGDIIAWTTPSNTLMSESNAFALEMIDVASEAMEEKRKGREGRAWIDAWLAKADAELARQTAAAAALPPLPAELERRYRTLGPDAVRQMDGFKALPGITRDVIKESEVLLNRLRPILIKAASGDEDAKLEVASQMLSGTRLAIRNENALLDMAIAMANRPDHPQVALSRSAKATNEAMMMALEYLERQINLEDPDPVATGKAMQAKVTIGRQEAQKAWPNARKIRAEFSVSLPEGPFRTNIFTALDTMEESARIEVALADLLGRMADRLTAGEETIDPDGTAFEGIEPLVNRRAALYEQRINLFKQR